MVWKQNGLFTKFFHKSAATDLDLDWLICQVKSDLSPLQRPLVGEWGEVKESARRLGKRKLKVSGGRWEEKSFVALSIVPRGVRIFHFSFPPTPSLRFLAVSHWRGLCGGERNLSNNRVLFYDTGLSSRAYMPLACQNVVIRARQRLVRIFFVLFALSVVAF